MSEQPSDLPKGSLVFVTGLTGYVASHIAKQLFEHGYKVRGTVRDLKAASWLTNDLFATQHAAGDLELVQVADIGAPDAFQDVLHGVSAVAHVATFVPSDPDPHTVIPPTVAATKSLLFAASKVPSVRRVVYTSSAVAAVLPGSTSVGTVTRDTWNDAAVQSAWAPPPYELSRMMVNYMASKVEAEKALWRFMEDEKPPFTVNVICPFTIIGQVLNPLHFRGTAGWVEKLSRGETDIVAGMAGMFHVHVKDVAALHVACLADSAVSGERIQAWAAPFTWNKVLATMRRLYPDRKFIDDLPEMGYTSGTIDDTLALRLLKKWANRDKWIGLEEAVRDTLDSVA